MSIPEKLRYYTTVGDNNSSMQAFYNNYWAQSYDGNVPVFAQTIPTYTTIGGTNDYYGQNPLSIFTNLAHPFIRYTFTGSTSAITTITKIVHKVYKIEYQTFKNFQINQPTIDVQTEIKSKNPTSPVDSTYSQRTGQKLGSNPQINFIRAYDQPLAQEDAKLLQPLLDEPYETYTTSTSGITTNIYDFYPDQYSKKLGQLKEELFEDKGQYFIETEFSFEIDKGLNYENYYTYVDGQLTEQAWNDKVNFTTTDPVHTITEGDFTGLDVRGAYFTYFTVPDKPQLEYPVVEGVLTTFAPEFFWSEGESADEYLIQIAYNTGDTSFSGTIFNYPISKNEQNRHFAESKIKLPTSEFSTNKAIRSASIPLKGNASSFLYRVGNVKYMENIFGVRQFVVTFSDTKSAKTQTEAVRTFVRVQSDSRYTRNIAAYTVPESLLAESPLAEYSLSGYVSGSIVTGATMQLIYPNLAFVTTTTDLTGYYEFGQLEDGLYALATNYRGYAEDIRNIYISGDTSLNVELQIRWDNTYDKWIVKESDIIKY
jgi:hypothetical protein